MYCSAKFGSSYEWDHHVIVSAQILSDAQREVLKRAAGEERFWAEGGGREEFEERERVLLRFLERTMNGPEVDDGLWEEMRGLFVEREIVEVMSLQVSSIQMRWDGAVQ